MIKRPDTGEGPADLADFTAQLPFALDPFQRRACEALAQGHGVLVCAPTGAGKGVSCIIPALLRYPGPVVVVDGILVLAFPAIRERLDVSVFVEAPAEVRLTRRLDRDVRERGRTPESVRAQFAATVAPMHEAFVSPCRTFADLVLDGREDPLLEAVAPGRFNGA